MHTQMMAIKEKGQKLYTCAPIWQELFNKVSERAGKKRSHSTDKETIVKKMKASGTQGQGSSSDSHSHSQNSVKSEAISLLQNLKTTSVPPQGSAADNLKSLFGSLVKPEVQKKERGLEKGQASIPKKSQASIPEKDQEELKFQDRNYKSGLEGIWETQHKEVQYKKPHLE